MNRTSLKYLVILLTLPTWMLIQFPAFGQNARAVVAKVFPSVVLLLMEDANGQPLSLGSGFVVGDGLVATNLHVIRNATAGSARLLGQSKGLSVTAIAAVDVAKDLAIVQVTGLRAPPLALGDSTKVSIGDEIFAVGNPQGLEGTISQGIISGIRTLKDTSILQVTAPISPGSSGGPIVDNRGNVIGVAVATFRGGQNLNFAIPANYVKALLSEPRKPIPLAELRKTKQAKSSLGDFGEAVVEGVVARNLFCNADAGSCWFSLANKLNRPVRNVRYVVVLYSAKGEPLDTREGAWNGVIRPGLAVRPVQNPGAMTEYVFKVPADLKKITAKMEIRILGFEVAE